MSTQTMKINTKLYSRKVQKPNSYLLPGELTPNVTTVFCIVCVIVYILDILTGYSLTTLGMKDNNMVINGGDTYRLFTCTLLHSGLIHLLSNIFFIRLYGNYTEFFYGHKKMAILILASGFTGSVFSLAFTDARSVGASGIAFGLVGAVLAARYAMTKEERSKMTRNCIYLIIVNLLIGLISGSIDNAAHIGGFLGGLMIGYGLSVYKETERKFIKKVGIAAYFIVNIVVALYAYTDIIPHVSINIWKILGMLF